MAKKGRKDKARKQAARAHAEPAAQRASHAADQPERVPADQPARAPGGSAPAATAPDAAASAGIPERRLASNLFIALFLAYQLAMPLRYYLGGRGYDERFSWRMFSTLRMQECKVNVQEQVGDDARAVDLNKALQIAWIGMLERYRLPVVEKLLARRCAREGVRSVRYERSCIDTDGSALPRTTVVRQCASGRLDVREGAQGAAE